MKNHTVNQINKEILNLKKMGTSANKISDGYHDFEELYYHRMILFSIICNLHKELSWKSLKHDDGSMYDNHFVVGINTNEGQYTYHYHIKHWDMFNVEVLEQAPAYDGHQPKDITRLLSLVTKGGINQ